MNVGPGERLKVECEVEVEVLDRGREEKEGITNVLLERKEVKIIEEEVLNMCRSKS